MTKATISLKDPDYTIQDSNIFNLKDRVYIYGGWQSEYFEKGPFKVDGLDLSYDSEGSPSMTVELKDPTVTEMSKKHKSKSYKGKRVVDVLKEIADSYGFKLDAQIEDADNYLFGDEFSLTQSLEDDSRFIQRLVDKIGYDFSMVNDTLVIERPELSRSTAIPLNYRILDRSIRTFKPNLRINRGGKKVSAKNKVLMVDPLASNLDYFDQLYELGLFDEPATIIQDTSIGQDAKEPYANEVRRFNRTNILSVDVERDRAIEFEIVVPPAIDGSPFNEESDFGFGDISELTDPSLNGATSLDGILSSSRDRFVDILQNQKVEQAQIDAGRIAYEANPGRAQLSVQSNIKVFIDPATGRNVYALIPENVVRENEAQALPNDIDKAQKQALIANRKIVPIECDIVPTVPSWSWYARENVFVDGVGKKVRGFYEIHEAVLTIDKDRGVQTQLKGKKRRAGTSKPKQGVSGASVDPSNPRQHQIQIQSQTKVYIDKSTGVNIYTPTTDITTSKEPK